MNPFDKLYRPGKMTLGIEFPLDNDWSTEGNRKRLEDNRPFGVPDISNHLALAQQIDEAGFAALWMRDVPVYDPKYGKVFPLIYTFAVFFLIPGIAYGIAAAATA